MRRLEREVALGLAGRPHRARTAGCSAAAAGRGRRRSGRRRRRCVTSVTGRRLSSSIAVVCRSPRGRSRRARRRAWRRAGAAAPCRGRWPTPVNICGRVSTSLTGRPTTRAASAVRSTCCQARSPAPNPPPRYGACTRTAASGMPNAAATTARTLEVHCVASCTVTVAVPGGDGGEQPERVVGVLRGREGRLVARRRRRRAPASTSPAAHVDAPNGSCRSSARASSSVEQRARRARRSTSTSRAAVGRLLRRVGDHDGDVLAVVQHAVVLQRAAAARAEHAERPPGRAAARSRA